MNKLAEISPSSINKKIPPKNYKRSVKNSVTAMVPVRAGSTRVQKKNTRTS